MSASPSPYFSYSVCTSGLHPTIAGILLAYDAYIDHQDAQGFTPLHLACRYGLVDMAQVSAAVVVVIIHSFINVFISS